MLRAERSVGGDSKRIHPPFQKETPPVISKRTPLVISKGLHPSFPYGKCHPPQRGGLAGSLFGGVVSRWLTEGVIRFEGAVSRKLTEGVTLFGGAVSRRLTEGVNLFEKSFFHIKKPRFFSLGFFAGLCLQPLYYFILRIFPNRRMLQRQRRIR